MIKTIIEALTIVLSPILLLLALIASLALLFINIFVRFDPFNTNEV